jgi:exodeoxyribonuclease VII large subunit
MARLPFDPEKTRAAEQARSQAPARTDAGATGQGDQPAAKSRQAPGQGDQSAPLTVSQLAQQLKTALADHFPGKLRVVGEVSNFSDRAHWFFSLKDENATLRCVCFAPNARKVPFQLADGMQIVATGRLDFYDTGGSVQLYCDKLEPVGQGALELQLRQLIDELRKQGYFDDQRKKPLPGVPRRVAVVTSRSAAALQDVINTARRRWAGCELLLYDVRVQGQAAAPEVARAIRNLSQQGERLGIDGIILTRGGGSIEDLWAFNEREVADALATCPIPTVAAIGHETDTTVAELVADRRCSTPTQAAMTLIPDKQTLVHQVRQLHERLTTVTRRRLDRARHRLHLVARHALFRQPGHLVEQARRRMHEVERRLGQALPRRLQPAQQARQQLTSLHRRLVRALPRRLEPARKQLRDVELRWQQMLPRRLKPARQQVQRLENQLAATMPRRLQHDRRRLDAAIKHLEAVSPHNVLQRGYSYTLDEQGHVIQSAQRVKTGQHITTVLRDGRVLSRVEGDAPGGQTAAPEKAKEAQPTRKKGNRQGSSTNRGRAARPSNQGGLFDG